MTKGAKPKDGAKLAEAPEQASLTDPMAYQITDPQEFAMNMFRLVEESTKAMSAMLTHSPDQAGPMSSTHDRSSRGRRAE